MSVSRLSNSLSPEQKDDLVALLDECRFLGATKYELAPLYAVVYLNNEVKEGAEIPAALSFDHHPVD